jgi:hypothetical protein
MITKIYLCPFSGVSLWRDSFPAKAITLGGTVELTRVSGMREKDMER